MFGEHVAHLKALIKTIEGHEQYVWKSFGNHGDTWHKATIHIPPMQTDYQVGLHNDIPSFFTLSFFWATTLHVHSFCWRPRKLLPGGLPFIGPF